MPQPSSERTDWNEFQCDRQNRKKWEKNLYRKNVCKYKIVREYKMSESVNPVFVNEYDVIAAMTIYK